MADTYNGLYLEPDWIPALLAFAPSELGRLIRCAILYSTSGQAPDLPGKERVLWPYIQSQIDQTCSAPHGEKQAPANPEKEPGTAGLGGALPAAAAPGLNYNLPSSAAAEVPPEKEREETSPIPPKEEIERLPPTTTLQQKNPVNNINNNNINNNIGGSGGSPRFRPPSLEDVEAYCRERRNLVDPQAFIDYYTSNGWRVGRNPMKDWKAAVRTWERKDAAARKPEKITNNIFAEIAMEEGIF